MPWKCKRAISFREYREACGRDMNKQCCRKMSKNGKCAAVQCKGWLSLKKIPTRRKVKKVETTQS